MVLFLLLFPSQQVFRGFNETMATASSGNNSTFGSCFSLSMTFYFFSIAFRSWGSVKRGPTYFTCLLRSLYIIIQIYIVLSSLSRKGIEFKPFHATHASFYRL
jgi:hypothetical protein